MNPAPPVTKTRILYLANHLNVDHFLEFRGRPVVRTVQEMNGDIELRASDLIKANLVVLAEKADMGINSLQYLQEVRFGLVGDDFIHVLDGIQDHCAFSQGKDRLHLFRSFDGWVLVQTDYKFVAVLLGFHKSQDVTRVDDIESTSYDTDHCSPSMYS